jgi:putative ABC transport system permease protein
MREWLARLRDWFRRDRLDRELAEELRFHREQLERDAAADGADAEEARYAAQRRLGNVAGIQEAARGRWSWPWLEHFLQDIRYAIRGLRRSPGFTTTVILTLGLGIGANAAMFGMIDQLMFRPFAYLRDPGTVHRVYLQLTIRERENIAVMFPYARYLDLKTWTTSFSQAAAFVRATHGVGTGEATKELPILGVSAGFFDFFTARPTLGRFFQAREDITPAGADVAVLGHGYWQEAYGGRDVIGQSIQVGNVPYTIIGVAPERFSGVSEGRPPALFLPITAYGANQGGGSRRDYFVRYNWDWTEMMVRRKPGVSRAAASDDLSQAFVRSRAAARALNQSVAQVERLSPRAIAGALKTAAGPDPGLEARTLLWVTGVAVIVLLIACANVANLFLARALRRRREVAVRLALGVSRRRLLAQSLTESLVLSLLGCVAGLGVAQWGGVVLRRLFMPDASALQLLTDPRTLAVAVTAALLAGLVTGLAPLVFAARDDLAGSLKAGVRAGTHQPTRLRAMLLILQGALSVVLLVGAGLFIRSLGKVGQLPLGYDANPLLMLEWERRGTPMDSSDRLTLRRRLLETARAIPGVEQAAEATGIPFSRGTSIAMLEIPGIDSVSRLGRFTFQVAGADYFTVIGTRILRGRPFAEHDRVGSPPVVVVSDAMARALWPGEEALGRCMRIDVRGARPDTMPCTEVVGIAENAVHNPAEDLPFRYYLPAAQVDLGGTLLLLRMRTGAAASAEAIRRTLQAVMPGNSYLTAQPARELVDGKKRSWRLGATMFVAFGALALLVAAVGLYGVISYNVAQRMHELGVRIALGAQARDVVKLVVGQGISFALAGVGLGLLVALLLARWIQPLLFQQSARDPATYGAVAALLLAVALVASAVPAFRATRADPNTALRSD